MVFAQSFLIEASCSPPPAWERHRVCFRAASFSVSGHAKKVFWEFLVILSRGGVPDAQRTGLQQISPEPGPTVGVNVLFCSDPCDLS